ncbi:MAG: hypothetical protein MZU91_02365 [Desulfosudis oleivorans]|nr:hypothetical protein [Desulfosudis oleivorans]
MIDLMCLGFDAAQHRGEERTADLGQDQPDGVGAFTGKHAPLSGYELKFIHGGTRAFRLVRLDRNRTIQYAAHGCYGNAGVPGDIRDRGGICFGGHVLKTLSENVFRVYIK